MRHPVRWRNVALGVAAVGAGSFTTALMLPEHALPGSMMTTLGMGGLMLGLFGGIAAGSMAIDAHGYRRLQAGKGLIAQWTVDGATWQAFLAYHDQLEPLNPSYPAWHKYRRDVQGDEVEILVGEKGLIMDGDYQRLPTKRNDCHFEELSLQPGPPVFVNMHLRQDYATKSGGMRHTRYSLRLPVPDGAVEEARLAITRLGASYSAVHRQSLAEKNPLLFYRVCLVLLVVCVGMFVTGMSFANKPQQMNQTLALVLAVVGAVLGLGALLGTAIGWSMSRGQRKQ